MTRRELPIAVAGGLLLGVGIFLVWRGISIIPAPHHGLTDAGKIFVLNGVLAAAIVLAPAALILRDWHLAGRGWSRMAAVPMLWALGGIFLLVAEAVFEIVTPRQEFPSDSALQNAIYVVSHFHYALRDCATFAFFAGFYFLFPKLTGWAYGAWLGRLHFAIEFIGLNIARLPLHIVKLRVFSEPMGAMDFLITLARLGFLVTAVGMIVFAGVLVDAIVRRRPAVARAAKA